MIGKTIGQYQVIDKIGEGGMGAVYKAEDTTLHRLVALKTLSGHLTEDEEAQERFVREAQSASSLNHPNITTVYEFIKDDDTRLICMEYVEGKTIRDMVESGIVSVRKAIDIIMQAAEALEAAHNKGILHRDVKSANIMVNMEGRVKVMDFGLAHLEERSQLTRTGTTMGTLSYSSPEQISGRPVDRRSEIFSLGVVFYELLTGQLPFKAANEAEILFAIINNEPPKLTKVRDDVPELVEAIVSRMLEKDSELRYQTCGEVINDLKGIRKEMETSTVGITGALKRVQTSRKKVMIQRVAASVVAVAIIACGLILLGRGGPKLDPDRIVVFPFENRTGDSSLDIWGIMAADQISRGISQTDLMGIVQFEDVEQMIQNINEIGNDQEKAQPHQVIAETYSAGTAVTGNIFPSDEGSIEFRVNIRDMRNGKYLRILPPVIGTTDDRSALLEKLHESVMGALATEFDPDFGSLFEFSSPPSLEAFIEFRDGLAHYYKTEISEGRQSFFKAASHDTGYVTPLLWAARLHIITGSSEADFVKADSLLLIVNRRRDRLLPLEKYLYNRLRMALDAVPSNIVSTYERVYENSAEAAELAPGTMWSFDAGQDALMADRPQEALKYFRQINPESVLVRKWSGYYGQFAKALLRTGEFREALLLIHRAKELFPDRLSLGVYEISALAGLGRAEEIIELLREYIQRPIDYGFYIPGAGLNLAADHLRRHGYRGNINELLEMAIQWFESDRGDDKTKYRAEIALTLYNMERWEDARTLFDELAAENPENAEYRGYLATLAARRNDREEAMRIGEDLDVYWKACIAAQLGDLDRAVDLLKEWRQTVRQDFITPEWDIDMEPLWDYPPYQALMKPKG